LPEPRQSQNQPVETQAKRFDNRKKRKQADEEQAWKKKKQRDAV
jgi:hypothetical protein